MRFGLLLVCALVGSALLLFDLGALQRVASLTSPELTIDQKNLDSPSQIATDDKVTDESPVKLSLDEIDLSDQSTTNIDWRRPETPSVEISPPFANHYSELRQKAEGGDAESAYVLYKILKSCRFAYENERELKKALQLLNSTHKIQVPELDEPVLLQKEESVRNWNTILRGSYQACVGISLGQRTERNRWLEQASNAGHPNAMREYSGTIQNFDDGIALDLARWRSGDAVALHALAKRYLSSYEQGNNPRHGVAAYAAMAAYAKLARENFERTGHRHDRQRMEQISSEMGQLEAKLHVYELERAELEADELIESNSNCCFVF